MSETRYPKIRVAAVQAGPVYMDLDGTLEKACRLIEEAGRNGAQLVAFPEVFIPGYPYWARYLPPITSTRYTKVLLQQAMSVPGPATERLTRAARSAGIYVVIGINEKSGKAHGTLFNTNLIISPRGEIIGRHRKLVPTLAEKLVWAYGDGEGLRVHDTDLGLLGTLICGENANPLARFVLIADGEQLHVANYLSLPRGDAGGYDLAKDIEIRSAAHSFEGKIFTITSSTVINKSVIDYYDKEPELQKLLSSGSVGHTAVYGPYGLPIAGPLKPDVEDILYADVNLEEALLPKLRHDIGGSYNRFDIMQVVINRSPHRSVREVDDGQRLENRDSGNQDEPKTDERSGSRSARVAKL